MKSEIRRSSLYKREVFVSRSPRGQPLFLTKGKAVGKGSPFGAGHPPPRECPTRPRRRFEGAEGMVASLVQRLRLRKRVYQVVRVRAGEAQGADGFCRRTPKGANSPWKDVESVCFYGAALRAATPACVAGRWRLVSFRIIRPTLTHALFFNGGRNFCGEPFRSTFYKQNFLVIRSPRGRRLFVAKRKVDGKGSPFKGGHAPPLRE